MITSGTSCDEKLVCKLIRWFVGYPVVLLVGDKRFHENFGDCCQFCGIIHKQVKPAAHFAEYAPNVVRSKECGSPFSAFGRRAPLAAGSRKMRRRASASNSSVSDSNCARRAAKRPIIKRSSAQSRALSARNGRCSCAVGRLKAMSARASKLLNWLLANGVSGRILSGPCIALILTRF
jgi:hypothetical protein